MLKGAQSFYLPPTSFNVSTQERCAGQNSIIVLFDEPSHQYNIELDGVLQNTSPIDATNWSLETSQREATKCVLLSKDKVERPLNAAIRFK